LVAESFQGEMIAAEEVVQAGESASEEIAESAAQKE